MFVSIIKIVFNVIRFVSIVSTCENNWTCVVECTSALSFLQYRFREPNRAKTLVDNVDMERTFVFLAIVGGYVDIDDGVLVWIETFHLQLVCEKTWRRERRARFTSWRKSWWIETIIIVAWPIGVHFLCNNERERFLSLYLLFLKNAHEFSFLSFILIEFIFKINCNNITSAIETTSHKYIWVLVLGRSIWNLRFLV